MKIIIYILCYDDTTEHIAKETFKEFDWARVYKLTNQNHLFEGKFLSVDLFELYDEWKDADYVGTLSYKAFEKINKEYAIQKINNLESNLYDVLFLYLEDNDLFHQHFQSGPIMRRIFRNMMAKTMPKLISSSWWNINYPVINIKQYNFCNYFVTRPILMYQYIQFFRTIWLPLLEQHPAVWNNALYGGKLKSEKLLELSNGRAPHYTYHAFINERLLYGYFQSKNVKMLF
jgi:hypothetical protein